jgi:uncharacterized cupin superfamily protein
MTDVTPGTPFLAAAMLAGELEDWGPLAEATGDPMQTSGATLWADGEQEVGVWECTPGPSYWKLETHEAVHIVSGRMTVTRTAASRRTSAQATAPCSRAAGRAPGRSTRPSASSTSCSEKTGLTCGCVSHAMSSTRSVAAFQGVRHQPVRATAARPAPRRTPAAGWQIPPPRWPSRLTRGDRPGPGTLWPDRCLG